MRWHDRTAHLLFDAAQDGSAADVAELLADGDDVNATVANGKTALYLAISTCCGRASRLRPGRSRRSEAGFSRDICTPHAQTTHTIVAHSVYTHAVRDTHALNIALCENYITTQQPPAFAARKS